MIRRFTSLLAITGALTAMGMPDPYLVESRVRTDLETLLSKLIPQEQYLVQVVGEVQLKQERRLVEGESLAQRMPREDEPPPPMPGFIPEPYSRERESPVQSRETYRLLETPALSSLYVRVSFDSALERDAIARARTQVQDYLNASYPRLTRLSFSEIPMLKPSVTPTPTPTVTPSPTPEERGLDSLNEKDEEDELAKEREKEFWALARWSVFSVVALVALFVIYRLFGPAPRMAAAGAGGANAPFPGLSNFSFPFPFGGGEDEKDSKSQGNSPVPLTAAQRRKKLLDKFLSRPEAFRLFYEKAENDTKEELYAALKGPGYESLLDGLGFKTPFAAEADAKTLEERLIDHERSFEEFVRASEWRQRQFFGFLGQLEPERLSALLRSQSAKAICVMLRFLKPMQSAKLLDLIPADKRKEIIGYASKLSSMPIADLVAIEREIRQAYDRLPDHLFPANEEVKFWGSVISESEHPDELLNEIERTNPEIYSDVKKYKFSLEDAASLPDNILTKVLGNVDNEILCLALSTCKQPVVEVFMDALSTRRREAILKQMPSYKGSPREQQVDARNQLTRQIREVLT